MLTTGTNNNLVSNLSKTDKIDSVEEIEDREQVKKAINSPQAIGNGEIPKRPMISKTKWKEKRGVRIPKGNFGVIVGEEGEYHIPDRKKRIKTYEEFQEAIMVDRNEEDLRKIREEEAKSLIFRKIVIREEIKLL